MSISPNHCVTNGIFQICPNNMPPCKYDWIVCLCVCHLPPPAPRMLQTTAVLQAAGSCWQTKGKLTKHGMKRNKLMMFYQCYTRVPLCQSTCPACASLTYVSGIMGGDILYRR
ncbi:hypothetical protein XELAEV_18037928mg [Xenopus laevis]|uniref:Uncharacterized protein n=1 Tax=Xenopus laevis TaxID=8355 RepID=A0A974CD16_XENLA|nr:hypothetical protein XELAEV_18037928mg [Xenopus laevis]